MKLYFSSVADTQIIKLVTLALLVFPILTWAQYPHRDGCQQADMLYNRSLKLAPAQQSQLLKQALSLCPTHWYALNNLATLLERQKNSPSRWLSQAQLLYNRAIKIKPDFAYAYAGLGDVLMQRQDYRQAAEAYQTFLVLATKKKPALEKHVQHYTKRLAIAQDKILVSASEILQALSYKRSFGPPKVDIQMNFAPNSVKLTDNALDKCRNMAKAINNILNMKGLQQSRIRIEGHTDNRGSAEYNKNLSQQRAESVTNVLVQFDVPLERLETIGWGEEKPIAPNKTAHGRFLNRRVTLVRIDKK